MEIQNRPIGGIKPYEKNAKKHPADQVKKVADSIREFGFNQPIVVDKDGVIIVGHGRYAAAQSLGLEVVPVLELDIDEERAKAYRLADNKLNESEWDMGLVVEELKLLSPEMLDLTGFDKSLILDDEGKADSIPGVPTEAKSKAGDVYTLGRHRVLCGDSTLRGDVDTLMNGMKADLFLTDPPYNVAYNDDSAENLKARRRRQDTLTVMNDKMEDGDFAKFLTDVFTNADAVMKAGAVFYIWHADAEGYNFRGACMRAGWTVRQCLIWNKNVMVMGRQDYHWKHEPCLYGWKEGASHLWNSDRTQTTVLDFQRPSRSESHPTMKPVGLMEYQIGNNTKGEDIVLDLFLGSGTTLIAAEKSGRTCYGMELDPKYMDVIVQRYVDFTGITEVLKNGIPEMWEVSDNIEPVEGENAISNEEEDL